MGAITVVTLAELEREAGHVVEARELAESSAAALERHLGPEHAWLWSCKAIEGLALHSLGRSAEARQILAAGVERDRRQADRSLFAVQPLLGLAWILHDENRCGEAEAHLRRRARDLPRGAAGPGGLPGRLPAQPAGLLPRPRRQARTRPWRSSGRSVPKLEAQFPNAPETIAAKSWMNALEGPLRDPRR